MSITLARLGEMMCFSTCPAAVRAHGLGLLKAGWDCPNLLSGLQEAFIRRQMGRLQGQNRVE